MNPETEKSLRDALYQRGSYDPNRKLTTDELRARRDLLLRRNNDAQEREKLEAEIELLLATSSNLEPTPAAVEEASEPKRGERQVLAILEEAKRLSIDPLAVPRGGKKALKDACLRDTALFTDSGFDHAWKNAIAEDPPRLRVTNHDIYARK